MSKTNDTSKLDRAKIENRVLADSELDAVTGGLFGTSSGSVGFKRSANELFGTSSGSVGF